MRHTLLKSALLALGLSAAAGAHASSLIGDSVHAIYLYPDTASVYSDLGTVVVGGSSPAYVNVNSASVLDIYLTGSQIIFSYTGPGSSFAGAFDGAEFTDTTDAFTSAALDPATNVPGTLLNAVTLVNGSVYVDLNGETYGAGENVTVDVIGGGAASAAPEPAAWALMLVGFGGVGAMARCGRNANRQTA